MGRVVLVMDVSHPVFSFSGELQVAHSHVAMFILCILQEKRNFLF